LTLRLAVRQNKGDLLARVEGAFVATILFVEDHEDTRELVGELLTASGHSVTGVGSAERGIEELRAGTFDVLVTDFWLDPGETGAWLLNTAQAEGLLGPAIMCTAERLLPPLPEGVVVLKKPVDIDALLAEVERATRASAPPAAREEPTATSSPPASVHALSLAPPPAPPAIELVLYMTRSQCSLRGLRNLRRVLGYYGPENVVLSIVDVTEDAPFDADVDRDRVAFTPTLVKRGPGIRERLVGDFADVSALEDLLDRAGLVRSAHVA